MEGVREKSHESRDKGMQPLAEQPALSKHSTDAMVAQVFGEHPSVSDTTHVTGRLPLLGLEQILSP